MTVPAGAVRLELPGLVDVSPGRRAAVAVTLTCTGSEPQRVVVALTGLDASWTPPAPYAVLLLPGSPATLRLAVHPPTATPPGDYPGLVRLAVLDPGTGAPAHTPQLADVVLRVGSLTSLAAVLEPAEPAAVRHSRVRLVLTNRGDEALPLHVRTESHGDLAARLGGDLVVPARSSVTLPGRLVARRLRLTGPTRRLPYAVTVQGATLPLQVHGKLVQRPVLRRPVLRALALVVVVAVWAATALVGLGALSTHLRESSRTSQRAADSGGQGGAGGSGGSGGSGSGGTGDGSGGGTDEQQPGAPGARVVPAGAAAGQRVSGTVQGASPGGVVVTLRPQALVDEAADEQVDYVAPASRPAPGGGKLVGALVAAPLDPPAVPQRTTTAPDGTWAFAGLDAPAYYVLGFEKTGYQTRRYIISTTAGGQPQTLEVPLTAADGTMAGRATVATPAGVTPPSVQVSVTDGVTSASTYTPTTGSVGRWALKGISTPGTYLVTAQATGYSAQSRLVTLGASGSAAQLDFSLTAGTAQLSGRVMSRSAPLGGATVTVTDGVLVRTVTSLTSAGSSADLAGMFTVPGLPIGRSYTVTVVAPGYATASQLVLLSRDTDLGDLTVLPATAEVCGTVRFADPQPQTGPEVAGLGLSGDAGTFKTTSASGSGAFSFVGIPAGTYLLTVSAFQRQPRTQTVTVAVGQDLGCSPGGSGALDVELLATSGGEGLATAQVQGRVLDLNTGRPVPCPDAASCPVQVADADPGIAAVTVDSRGNYLLPPDPPGRPLRDGEGLRAGVHRLTVSDTLKRYEPQTVSVAVAEGQVATAPLVTLAPFAQLDGTVAAGAGPVPVGTCVVAVQDDPSGTPPPYAGTCPAPPAPGGPCPTDAVEKTVAGRDLVVVPVCPADGRYAFTSLEHGTYTIYVVLPDAVAGLYVPFAPLPFFLALGQHVRQNLTFDRLGQYVLHLNGISGPLPAATKVEVDVTAADGSAVTGLSAVCSDTDAPTRSQPFETCADSTVTLVGLAQGSYTVSVGIKGSTLSDTQAGQVVALNQVSSGSFTLLESVQQWTGSVQLDVPARTAVPGAEVTVLLRMTLRGAEVDAPPTTEDRSLTALTDSGGCFAFALPPAAAVAVGALAPGGPCASARPVLVGPAVPGPVATGFAVLAVEQVSGPTGYTTAVGPFPASEIHADHVFLLPAPATAVAGRIALDPALAPVQELRLEPTTTEVNGTDPAGSRPLIQVVVAQPGVTVTVDAKGYVDWQQDGLADGQAVPGDYDLQITGDGYRASSSSVHVSVPVDAAGPGGDQAHCLTPDATPTVIPRSEAKAPLGCDPLATLSAVDDITIIVQDAPGPGVTASRVAGATVRLTHAGLPAFADTTGSDGTVVDRAVAQPVGGLALTVTAPGLAPRSFAGVNVRAGGRTIIVELSAEQTISGSVTGILSGDSPGAPVTSTLTDVTVTIWSVATSPPVDYTCPVPPPTGAGVVVLTTTATGTFSEAAVQGTTYCVAPGHVPGFADPGPGRLVRADRLVSVPLEWRLPAKRVRTTVTVTDGDTVLTDARVEFTNTSIAFDEVGTSVDLYPLTYTLSVTRPGYADKQMPLTITPSDAANPVPVELAPLANTLTVTVTADRPDQPLGTTTVSLSPAASPDKPTFTFQDPEGRLPLIATFVGVPRGGYVVSVAALDVVDPKSPITLTGTGLAYSLTVPVQRSVHDAVVTVTPTVSTSALLRSLTLSLTATSGGAVTPNPPDQPLAGAPDGKSGVATFRALAPGLYVAKVTNDQGLSASQDVLVKPGPTSSGAVPLALPDIRIGATVRSSGGTPAQRTVTVDPAGVTPTFTVPADSGSVDLYLDPGTYTVTSRAKGSPGSAWSGLSTSVGPLASGKVKDVALDVLQQGSATVTVQRGQTLLAGAAVTADDGYQVPATYRLVPAHASPTCTAPAAPAASPYTCTGLLPTGPTAADLHAVFAVVTQDQQTFSSLPQQLQAGTATAVTVALPAASLLVRVDRNGKHPEPGSIGTVQVRFGTVVVAAPQPSAENADSTDYLVPDLAPDSTYGVTVQDLYADPVEQVTASPRTGDAGAPTVTADVTLSGIGLALTVTDARGSTVTDVRLKKGTASAVGTQVTPGEWLVRGLSPGTWTVSVTDGVATPGAVTPPTVTVKGAGNVATVSYG